jgi:hypothetical protein
MYDYDRASLPLLLSWYRQFGRTEYRSACERGHPGCGFIEATPRLAPCHRAVIGAYQRQLMTAQEIG